MIRTISLISAIFIFLLVLVLVFENLFFGKATYYILFWEMNGSVSWLILGIFFLGIIFGAALFTFFSSNPFTIDPNDDLEDKNKDWE